MRVCVIFAFLFALITIYLSSTLATEDSRLTNLESSRVERSADADAGRRRMAKKRGLKRKLKNRSGNKKSNASRKRKGWTQLRTCSGP